MENIVKSLKIKCAEAGTNLTKACKATGVNRSMIDRWQKKEPKSFQNLRKIEKFIEDQKQRNSKV